MIAGDFNLTMWNAATGRSPTSRNCTTRGKATASGRPGRPSGALGVPIDHILGTQAVQFRNFRVLGAVGSDHLPVLAEFSRR